MVNLIKLLAKAEMLEKIKLMASAMYSLKQIADSLDVSYRDFLEEYHAEGSLLFETIRAAQLETEFKISQSITDMAEGGSQAAQKVYLDLEQRRLVRNFEDGLFELINLPDDYALS